MTIYELLRLLSEPFLPSLYYKVRHDLKQLLRNDQAQAASLLDVGARNSPYTIGLPATVTILDIPRQSSVQRQLNLGITDELLKNIRRRRSNIEAVVIQDMTECSLPSDSFHGVVCIEVIEHVIEDGQFLEQIKRVLKPGGWLYLTTPNGDYVKNEPPNYNPDHVRHYKKEELKASLEEQFENVTVLYGIKTGKYRYVGQQTSLDWRHPLRTAKGMFFNLANLIESRGLDHQARRTAHLFAVGRKPKIE